ncbi:MAG: hypothetical protein AB1403_06290 [Candidatus Riflebacteria bacterium]
MSDEILIRLDEITGKASVPQLKYWCKLLDINPKVISRAGHVSPKDAEKLRKMADLINAGIRPRDAANTLADELMIKSSEPRTEDTAALNSRIESLEKAVMLLVQTVNNQSKKLEAIQLCLEPPKVEPISVKVWEPAPKVAPQFPVLKRLWYELVDPVKLRAN